MVRALTIRILRVSASFPDRSWNTTATTVTRPFSRTSTLIVAGSHHKIGTLSPRTLPEHHGFFQSANLGRSEKGGSL
jgi:hypothetical protein